jgi:hypothetical protein
MKIIKKVLLYNQLNLAKSILINLSNSVSNLNENSLQYYFTICSFIPLNKWFSE